MGLSLTKNLVVFLLLAALVGSLGLIYLDKTSVDEGVYILIAKKMVEGWTPYVDIAENKPPGFYFLLMPGVAIAGESLALLRVYGYLFTLATAYMIFLMGRDGYGRNTGLLAAIVYVILIFNPLFGSFGLMTEPISNAFIAACVYLLAKSLPQPNHNSGKPSRHFDFPLWLAIGFAIAGAISIKQTSIFLFVPFLYSLCKSKSVDRSKALVTSLLGMLLLAVPVFGYLVSKKALHDALYYTVVLPIELGGSDATAKVFNFILVALNILPTIAFAIFGIVKVNSQNRGLLLSWLLGSLALVQLGYSDPRHYVFILPPLLIFACAGLFWLLRMTKEMKVNSIRNEAIVIAALAASANMLFLPIAVRMYDTEITGKVHESFYFPDTTEVVSFLKANTAPTEGILVFRENAEIYYFSGRDPIVKVPFFYSNWFREMDDKQLEEYLLGPIKEKKPRYIVVNRIDLNEIGIILGKNLGKFEDLLYERYSLERTFGIYDIYSLKS